MNDKTFSARYCAQNDVPEAEFVATVLRRSLYGHARILAPLIRALWPGHFIADTEFVQNVGRLTRMRDFYHEAEEYVHHPANHGFWRKILHVRVSARTLGRIVRETLHAEGADAEAGKREVASGAPFTAPKSGKTQDRSQPEKS